MKALTPLYVALLSSAVLSSAALSQGAVLRTHSNVGIFTGDAKSLLLRSTKANTVVKDPLNQQVNTVTGVSASSQISLRSTNGFHVVTVADRGAADVQNPAGAATFGTTSSSDPKNIKQGPTSVLLSVSAPVGAKSKIRIRYSGKLAGKAFAKGFVDIGNDNKVEFQQSAGSLVEKEFIAVAGPSGLQIRIGTDAGASFRGKQLASYESGLIVIVMPQPSCTYTSYGTSCGAKLSGSSISTPGGALIIHDVSAAPPASPGGVFLGAKKTALKIPGTACSLYTQPILFMPFFVSGTGKAHIVLGAGPVEPFTFYSQVIVLGRTSFKLSASNGLEAVCK